MQQYQQQSQGPTPSNYPKYSKAVGQVELPFFQELEAFGNFRS